MKVYHVYILANLSRTLYTGITSELRNRVNQHRLKVFDGFTKRYHIDRLVYYEEFKDVRDAITREKQIKGWSRNKKIVLIESMNPEWKDLFFEI